jgi:hypothetical protein
MAFTATTLAAALADTEKRAKLTAVTNVVAGSSLLKIDDEWCKVDAIAGLFVDLSRGLNGSKVVAHGIYAPAIHTTNAAEFSAPIPEPRVYSYGASGAITVAPGLHYITKGSIAAMTLADPPADQNGMMLTVASTTAYAHTLTMATAVLGSTETVYTFGNVVGHSKTLVSYKGKWAEVNTSRAANENAGVAVADP